MTELAALWLPILLGAVFVFVASSIIHMGPLWHRNDFPQLPDEDKARAAIGALGGAARRLHAAALQVAWRKCARRNSCRR